MSTRLIRLAGAAAFVAVLSATAVAGAQSIKATNVALGSTVVRGSAATPASASRDQETASFRWGDVIAWVRVTGAGAVNIYAAHGYRSAFAQPVTLTADEVDRFADVAERVVTGRRAAGDSAGMALGDGQLVLEPAVQGDSGALVLKIGATRADAITATVVAASLHTVVSALRATAGTARDQARAAAPPPPAAPVASAPAAVAPVAPTPAAPTPSAAPTPVTAAAPSVAATAPAPAAATPPSAAVAVTAPSVSPATPAAATLPAVTPAAMPATPPAATAAGPVTVTPVSPVAVTPVSPVAVTPVSPVAVTPASTAAVTPASTVAVTPVSTVAVTPVSPAAVRSVSPVASPAGSAPAAMAVSAPAATAVSTPAATAVSVVPATPVSVVAPTMTVAVTPAARPVAGAVGAGGVAKTAVVKVAKRPSPVVQGGRTAGGATAQPAVDGGMAEVAALALTPATPTASATSGPAVKPARVTRRAGETAGPAVALAATATTTPALALVKAPTTTPALAAGKAPAAAPAAPVVTAGEGEMLASSTVGNLVRQWEPQLQMCYTDVGLKTNPALSGSMMVRVAIRSTGDVSAVEVAQHTWSAPAGVPQVEACVRSRVKGWLFPPATVGSTHDFKVIFTH